MLREAAPSTGAGGHLEGSSLPPLIQRILLARGFNSTPEVDKFCDPSLADLLPPDQLPGISAASERLLGALKAGQSIVIYGDYDVDGITATAILYHMLKAMNPDADIRTFVPHRIDDGYGLNASALEQMASEGCDLVVSVDCGITACEPVAAAKKAGLSVIITDHHTLNSDGSLPGADVLVHPGLPGSDYQFRDLSGAGVAYKLAWQMAVDWCGSQRVSEKLREVLLDLLPLVALGTIADVVPLLGENRILARWGLRRMLCTNLSGLQSLIEVSGVAKGSIDAETVGFRLAPRLNACGRMGHARQAIELLTTATRDEGHTIATELTQLNTKRQALEAIILEQACELAESKGMTSSDCRVIVLAHEKWHPGVVGIVCSRLAEKYGRPAILLQQEAGLCKGSARSIPGYSIHEALVSQEALLESYGGHAAAAGLTIRSEQLDAFVSGLKKHANKNISEATLMPELKIDCEAELSEFNDTSIKALTRLAPFGQANARPVVCVRDVILTRDPQVFGKEGNHLALVVKQETPRGPVQQRMVWWRSSQYANQLTRGMQLDIAASPKKSSYTHKIESEIRDVKIKTASPINVRKGAPC